MRKFKEEFADLSIGLDDNYGKGMLFKINDFYKGKADFPIEDMNKFLKLNYEFDKYLNKEKPVLTEELLEAIRTKEITTMQVVRALSNESTLFLDFSDKYLHPERFY